jgi:hypothetical protein
MPFEVCPSKWAEPTRTIPAAPEGQRPSAHQTAKPLSAEVGGSLWTIAVSALFVIGHLIVYRLQGPLEDCAV